MDADFAFSPSLITAAILAGGEGRRVGGLDKGLVELAGTPIVARVVAALRQQAGCVVVCANRHADDYAEYGRVIGDAVPGYHGPLAGLASALAHCATPWLLSVPVDGPDLPDDLARQLFAGLQSGRYAAAVAFDGRRRQPLFALYRAALAESAGAALRRNSPIWRWQDEIGAAEVNFADRPQAFANLNTLEDFREWERTHAG